jgi:hypothetical protein
MMVFLLLLSTIPDVFLYHLYQMQTCMYVQKVAEDVVSLCVFISSMAAVPPHTSHAVKTTLLVQR